MFTGIIRELGRIANIYRSGSNYQIKIEAKKVLQNLKIGDSIAVNGVCLTVVDFGESSFIADVMPETLKRTNLRDLNSGDKVNLEPSLGPEDFFDGHIVTGHIDGVGQLTNIVKEKNAWLIDVAYPADLNQYLVEKGSIAVNGISLTLVNVEKDKFRVSLIPESWRSTTFHLLKTGAQMNLETDILGKYVVKTVKNYLATDNNQNNLQGDKGLSREVLQKNNFI